MQEFQTPGSAAQWLLQNVTGSLCADSRKVQTGDGFVAWPGAAADGRQFVTAAQSQGASACLVELEGMEQFALTNGNVGGYAGLKKDTGAIASEFFGNPSTQLAVLAVTGTNGKTSTAWWLAQALSALPSELAIPCGAIGTMGVGRPPIVVSTGLTTPDPVLLQRTLRQFVADGIKACAIEASSIGIEEYRLNGTQVRVAIFTNFTQDHLDYHGSMEAYRVAKEKLFTWPGLKSAVLNVDDLVGAALAETLCTGLLDIWTVSTQSAARLQAQNIRYGEHGLVCDVREGDAVVTLSTRTIGEFNVSNLLGVIAAMRSLGVPLQDAVNACSELLPVPGRMECLGTAGEPVVAVDYAHTPDALSKALQALRPLATQRGGRLWCVFGCGGDRDATKRPLMGAIAAQLADQVLVTSDNPRSEKAESIVAQILLGMTQSRAVDVQLDRAQAIADVIARAGMNDVILLAGKGHEETQEIAGVKNIFSDRTHASTALQKRAATMMTVQQAAQWIPDAELVGDGFVSVLRVHTDTRTIEPGDLFVALKGERFDANDFLQEAQQRGAVAVVCHAGAPLDSYPANLPRIEVPDTTLALGALATAWRAQFKLPLIAVTGSNGKTTVTQMVASILDAFAPNGSSLATRGNLNNDIGVPLTLLRLRAHHRIAVWSWA